MTRIVTIVALTLMTLSIAAQSRPAINELKWMAGCWELSRPDRKSLVSEHWMMPVGNAMMGMSRTLRNDKMSEYEFLRIVDDGTAINYIAKPSASKEETAFKLVKSGAGEAVFENLAHDFPQRIIYKQTTPDALAARIEGNMNGSLRGMDFPLTRAKCQ
jgi:hypothetical protein